MSNPFRCICTSRKVGIDTIGESENPLSPKGTEISLDSKARQSALLSVARVYPLNAKVPVETLRALLTANRNPGGRLGSRW